jgi:hypothetical protein
MERLSVEAFLSEVLGDLEGIPDDLRARLVEVLDLRQATRVRQLEKAFEEAASG